MFTHDEIQDSSVLDQILYDGDALYNQTVNSLKAEGKLVKSLLSLEEIPDAFDTKSGQYFVEKQTIACGALVNTLEDEALPTLHSALETAFLKSTSVLLIIGAVCSVISKRNNLYVFLIHILMEKVAFLQVMVHLHLSNVLTDHFSNSLPEKTTKDIPMKFSQCPFKTIVYRLPLSNRGIYLQIIHLRRKAIFTFYGTCIACVNNITFQIRYFTRQ